MTSSDYISQTKEFFNGLSFDLPDQHEHLAVIVETREVENFGAIVKNHLHFLPDNFGLLVVCCKENEAFVGKELESVTGYSTMTLPSCKMDSATYNELLTSFNFWRVIKANKVLIFQTDSLLLRKGIDRYLMTNYVGAPLYHFPMPSMNGGLSIRDVTEMQRITRDFKYRPNIDGNEDIYFCKFVRGVADKHLAQQFSVETIFFPTPIGVHACDKYLKPEESKVIFEKALTELKQTA